MNPPQCFDALPLKSTFRRVLVLLVLFVMGAASSRAQVVLDPARTQGAWEGWGVSLCWWAKVFGDRDDIADLLFTTKETAVAGQRLPGLGLNIARYNAGACGWNTVDGRKMVVSKTILPFRQIEGFWLDGKMPTRPRRAGTGPSMRISARCSRRRATATRTASNSSRTRPCGGCARTTIPLAAQARPRAICRRRITTPSRPISRPLRESRRTIGVSRSRWWSRSMSRFRAGGWRMANRKAATFHRNRRPRSCRICAPRSTGWACGTCDLRVRRDELQRRAQNVEELSRRHEGAREPGERSRLRGRERPACRPPCRRRKGRQAALELRARRQDRRRPRYGARGHARFSATPPRRVVLLAGARRRQQRRLGPARRRPHEKDRRSRESEIFRARAIHASHPAGHDDSRDRRRGCRGGVRSREPPPRARAARRRKGLHEGNRPRKIPRARPARRALDHRAEGERALREAARSPRRAWSPSRPAAADSIQTLEIATATP